MKKGINVKSAAGFTFSEILVAIAILSIGFIILINVYYNFINDYMTQKKTEEMQFMAVQTVSYMEIVVRAGKNYRIPYENGVLKTDRLQFYDQHNIIDETGFNTGRHDQLNEIRVDGDGNVTHYIYDTLNNNQLIRKRTVIPARYLAPTAPITFTTYPSLVKVYINFSVPQRNTFVTYPLEVCIAQRTMDEIQ
ncbi:MAG: type II secretion system protein [Bacillota bacterium]